MWKIGLIDVIMLELWYIENGTNCKLALNLGSPR